MSPERADGKGRVLTFAKLIVLSCAYFIGAAIAHALTARYSVYLARAPLSPTPNNVPAAGSPAR
jgi:hypothetical protein